MSAGRGRCTGSCRRFVEIAAYRTERRHAYEDLRSRTEPVIVVGERSCDDLPVAAEGAGPARPRHYFLRTGSTVVCGKSGSQEPGLLRARALPVDRRAQRFPADDK